MSNEFLNITSDEQMINYARVTMGMPVINIELESSQYSCSLADSILEYQKYAGLEGNFQEYCILNISASQNFYPISAVKSIIDNGEPVRYVQSINDVQVSTGLDNINALFSPSHILLIESGQLMNPMGSSFGPLLNPGIQGEPLSQYYSAIGYLKMITEMFGKSLAIRFIQGRQTLETFPSPTTSGPCLIELTRGCDPANLYNLINFRKLFVSRCLLVYSRILRKYQGQLPDGLSISSSEIATEGNEMYNSVIKDIISQSPPCDFSVF